MSNIYYSIINIPWTPNIKCYHSRVINAFFLVLSHVFDRPINYIVRLLTKTFNLSTLLAAYMTLISHVSVVYKLRLARIRK